MKKIENKLLKCYFVNIIKNMSYHFSMGAINKNTNNYEYPKIANKEKKYKCPSCEKNVIFKNGKILKPHFAHYKSDNPCYYYDKPSETQIHKDAKMLMKTLLDNKKNIFIYRTCNYCKQRNCGYSEEISYDIKDNYNENTKAIVEYKFYYNNSNRSADVALIENDKIIFIFEICYKNKTKEENRPEPWVEINAENLINQINSGENIDEEGNIRIECIKNYKCNECKKYEEYEDLLIIKRNLYYEKLKQEQIENDIKLKKYQFEKEIQEREIRERKTIEILKQKEEEDRIRKEQEEKLLECCKCGIMLTNICICKIPNFELIKLSNNLFCVCCNKWKDRCKL